MMKRIMTKLLFGGLWALLLVSIAAALLLFYPPAFKCGLEAACRLLPVAVDIENVRHVPGRLRLSGLRIATPMGSSCEIASLEIVYRPLSLALGRIEITSLQLQRPAVTILRFPEGRLDLLEPSAGPVARPGQGGEAGTNPWGWLARQVRIEALSLKGGSVRVRSPDRGLTVAWNSLDLEGDYSGRPLEGNLHLRKGRIRVANEPHAPLEMTTQGDASFAGGRIRLARLRMTLQDAAVSLHGEYTLADRRSRFDAELSALPLDRILEQLGMGGIGVTGVSGGLTVETEGDDTALFTAHLNGAIHGRRTRTRIRAGLRNGIVTYEMDAGPSLRLTGQLRPDNLDTEAWVQARGLDLSFLAKQWTLSPSRLSLTGKASFRGNLNRKETWKGEAKIGELLCSFPDFVVSSAHPFELRMDKGLLEGKASLEVDGAPLSVHGRYPFTGEGNVKLDGSASLALENLSGPARKFLPSLRSWKGDLRVEGILEGPLRAPRLHAVADLSNGSFRLASPDERVRSRPLKTDEGSAEAMGAQAQKTGILAASVRMHIELDGAVAAPAGSLDLHITGGRLYGTPLDEVRLRAASRDGRLWDPRLEIRGAWGALSLDGEWNVSTGAVSGKISSTDLNLAPLIGTGKMPIQGIGHIDGSLGGTTRAPRIELRTEARALMIQNIPAGDLAADLVYGPGRISLNGKTDSGWFEASINTKRERAFSFRGSLEDLPIGPLLKAAHLEGWSGQASLSGKIEGPAADMRRWEGEIDLKRLDVLAGADAMRLERPVSIRFARGQMTIPEASLLTGDSRLLINGSLGRENRLSIRGTVPLRPLEPLIPFARFDTGKAETDLMVRGDLSSPYLEGRIHVEARGVKVAGLAYPADSIEADIQAASNRVTLHSFRAAVADGELRASGAMTLEPLTFENVVISLKAVPIRLTDTLAGSLQGSLTFTGNPQDSLLRGNLEILEARYEENFNLTGMLLRPTRPHQDTVRRREPFLEGMRLDLRVRSGPSLFVRNNLGRLILSTTMEIKGTAAKPVPLGIVRVEEGRIFFSNKTFVITQGSLAFTDPSGGRPRLQLESKVKIQGQSREYLIHLALAGPLDRIRLDLRSTPDLEREDIIFLLLTGKTRDEYYASSEDSTDREEAVQSLAVSGLGSLFGNDVRAMTGLDTFLMERTEGKAFGVKTTVGKHFNERIDVRGIFALGSGQQVSEAQVGYLLTDMFYVVGTQRTDGSFGLDFRIRLGNR